jgi:arsenate reductase
MIKIYHNPRCSKSRAGLKHLEGKKVEFELVEYLKYPLTKVELMDILMKMHIKPFELVRTQEELYKKELKGQEFNEDEWIKILLENPKLIKRPLVVKGYKAVWAVPPEEMDRLF